MVRLKWWIAKLVFGFGLFFAGFLVGLAEPSKLGGLTRAIRSLRTPAKFPSATFAYLPGEADVIMLGDSLTAATEWSELLPGAKVINRGIDSDTTFGVEERLREVIGRHPKKIFLMIGVNDVRQRRPRDEILENYGRIVRRLNAAGAAVYVQSVLFLGRDAEGLELNGEIAAVNEGLRELCAKTSSHYVDLTPLLCGNGQLDPRLTTDGLHLNGQGYLAWAGALRQLLP